MKSILQPIAVDPRLAKGEVLPLMEHFYTIQGEGFHAGKAAYFVRIGGCDVGCHWCDVKESWDPSIHPLTEVATIVQIIKEAGVKDVVVTGGEPSLFNLEPLTTQLKAIGCRLYIETSGANLLTGNWDWICLSPKKNVPPVAENLKQCHELKVIVHNQNDFEWAEHHAKMVGNHSMLFLQPEWSKSTQMMPLIVDYVLKHPKWQVSLQTHKFMHIP